MVFYKLTYLEFKDFEDGKTIAVPSKDPYHLFPIETAKKQFASALQYTLSELKHFTYDFKCLKDKYYYRVYVMAALFKDIN